MPLTDLPNFDQEWASILPVALPDSWLGTFSYDTVEPILVTDTNLTLSFTLDGYETAAIFIEFNSNVDWSVTREKYINDEMGAKLLTENDLVLLLE